MRRVYVASRDRKAPAGCRWSVRWDEPGLPGTAIVYASSREAWQEARRRAMKTKGVAVRMSVHGFELTREDYQCSK